MLNRNQTLPTWYENAIKQDAPFSVSTIFYDENGECFFDGIVGALLHRGVVPHKIDIAMDASYMAPVIRLQFGPDEDVEEFQHYPFAPDSFASLWNDPPEMVSGFPVSDIRLSALPGDEKFPILLGNGVMAVLFFEGTAFKVEPILPDAEPTTAELETA